MSFAYHKHAASFAKLTTMRDFFSGVPDMESFIQEGLRAQMQGEDVQVISTKEEFMAWKQKYGIKMSDGLTESSDEDSESDTERKDGLLCDEKKIKEKVERKRLKKQRQKERKRLEKQQNATQDSETKDISSGACNGDKDCLNLRDMASALDSDSSSDDESGNEEDEGLDLTSSFVTKAAEIAKRKLEQKQENKEKKKSPAKEEVKTPEKRHDEVNGEVTMKDAVTSSPQMEDLVKISAEFATMGNKLAGAGYYKTAVKYFTDAIKYNPTEYRLFGNRAFCFERIQEYEKSLSDAELSLSMSPGWVKGLFRKGRALAGLKRYEEAACSFREVLELERSSTEAVQDLMRVQVMQLMEYGFTREQSSHALVIHGSVEKALAALSELNKPVSRPAAVPLQQVANVTGVSPGLSARAAAAPRPPPVQDSSNAGPESKPLIPVQNQQSPAKPDAPKYDGAQALELFPVWVGNLSLSVTEHLLGTLFNKVGTVYSIKQLSAKRCAFINFTRQQHCDDAIRRYHGFELMGSKLAVRYPDRIAPGLNISRAAHKAHDSHDENLRYNLYAAGRSENRNPYHHHNYRNPYKN
ncbi:uncharacterized protein [Eucyclogobius newberryi]|uniref:uncharacterized protein n=1 Tax=Eucyclogobius newberryi TaxID=166745 RepID=UPI003B5C6768